MDKIEAIQRIRTHMIVHHMEESPNCQYITEALKMALNALGAIDQIRWERDIAIEQLRDLGIGFGQKIDGVYLTKEEYDKLPKHSFICNVCENYKTDKCENCNGQGKEWMPVNNELYKEDPYEYIKNLILVCSD